MRGAQICFYGGIILMSAAGLGTLLQTIVFFVKKKSISKKMDQEYGNPLHYGRQGEGGEAWR